MTDSENAPNAPRNPRWPSALRRSRYSIVVSVITPHIGLMNDGKMPFLGDFLAPVVRAVQKAAGAAYRAMVRPAKKLSIKDAAWLGMDAAYDEASANPGREPPHLPVKPRQIVYRARPQILELTGVEKFGDSYFTQTLLPDYVDEHPKKCADWDIVWDARGHLTEPHTGRIVPLGTLEVRSYLGRRPALGPAAELHTSVLYPTYGPANRYKNCLYIEKEGFDALLQAAQIAERFDMMIMSEGGVRGKRRAGAVVRACVRVARFRCLRLQHLRDARDGRSPLHLQEQGADRRSRIAAADAEAMDLQSEPVEVEGDRSARQKTLRRHGATEREINFLLGLGGHGSRRIELARIMQQGWRV